MVHDEGCSNDLWNFGKLCPSCTLRAQDQPYEISSSVIVRGGVEGGASRAVVMADVVSPHRITGGAVGGQSFSLWSEQVFDYPPRFAFEYHREQSIIAVTYPLRPVAQLYTTYFVLVLLRHRETEFRLSWPILIVIFPILSRHILASALRRDTSTSFQIIPEFISHHSTIRW